MLTADMILKLLTDTLTSDFSAKYRIRSDYEKYKRQMSDADARLLATAKYLKSEIPYKDPYKW
jgi:hypothetical protein